MREVSMWWVIRRNVWTWDREILGAATEWEVIRAREKKTCVYMFIYSISRKKKFVYQRDSDSCDHRVAML